MYHHDDEIRYRHVRAATAAVKIDGGRRHFPDDRLSRQDRTAYHFTYDGELTSWGDGGYANLYYPVSYDRERGYGGLFGDTLCARCATAYLQADSANAVFVHSTANGGFDERAGEYCTDCGECILDPHFDAVTLHTDDDDFDGSLLYLTVSDWDVDAAGYGLFVIRAMLPRYPNLRIERRNWESLTDLQSRFGIGAVYAAMRYVNF